MEKSSFFNSKSGDRKYKAEDWADYFGSFIGNGVFPSPSIGLQVIASSDMSLIVKAGKAWINGRFYFNTSDLVKNLETAHGILNRIDRVVIRCDFVERTITSQIKTGVSATNPVAIEMQRDADAYELAIADVLVQKGVVSITQSNITDLRMNTSFCGISAGLINQIDTTDLFSQYTSAFNLWFDEIKDILDESTATNLLNMINEHTTNSIVHVTEEEKAKWNDGGLGGISGSSTFNGTTGKIINHTLGNTNYTVSIIASANPAGTIGEIWVTKAINSITVFNSGSFTGAFDYVILKY